MENDLHHVSVTKVTEASHTQTQLIVNGEADAETESELKQRIINKIGQDYSKAQAFLVTWNTDVNLNPPKVWKKEIPKEDIVIKDYYNTLQYILYETGYPETIDRTSNPNKEHVSEHVAIAILSSPLECIGMLLEGGHSLPGAFHLILSPSWLLKIPSKTDPDRYTLLITKAITFYNSGCTYIDEFEYPRQVTCFVNYSTKSITGGLRNDGEEMETNLDCPLSSCIELSNLVDDKVWTRGIMATVGLEIPDTLAFPLKPKRKLLSIEDKMIIYQLNDNVNLEIVTEYVKKFLSMIQLKGRQKVVVKPSGPPYFGSIGVSYHDVCDVSTVVHAVHALITQIEDGCSVLVESYVEPLKCRQTAESEPSYPWLADETLGCRVRATVCRDHTNTPVTTLITCGIASQRSPINGDNTICQSLNTTLLTFNILERETRQKLENDIRDKSEALLECIINQEKTVATGKKAQTNIIGIDYIITTKENELVPVGIEANSQDCTVNCHIYEFMAALLQRTVNNHDRHSIYHKVDRNRPQSILPKHYDLGSLYRCPPCHHVNGLTNMLDPSESNKELLGACVRPWVETMILMSQQHAMRGKRVLVIGARGHGQRNIWSDATAYDVEIILVGTDAEHNTGAQVHTYIHYNFDDHHRDAEHARWIYNELQRNNIHVDGCLTFSEDCGPLAELVSEKLGTQASSFEGASNAKWKSRTQTVLRTRKDDIPHWPRTYLYTSDVYQVTTVSELQSVADRIKFPAILTLENDLCTVECSLVRDMCEFKARHAEISASLCLESNRLKNGLGYDHTITIMDYHAGSEHNVDVIIFKRKLIDAFISDIGPMQFPRFTETAAMMPSCLPIDKQAQIIAAAYQCCTEIGLSNGTFTVKFKMTACGPKVIAVNGIMGAYYQQDWIQIIYGVDLMLYSMMLSCGIKPYVPKCSSATYLVGIMLLPSLHKHILLDHHSTVEKMHANGDIVFTQFISSSHVLSGSHDEPFANIAVRGQTAQECKDRLLKICQIFSIDSDAYKIADFVTSFK